jgi:L-ascorbate metabolism protein UlaG (beta-lactamase superfamily)
VRPGVATPYPNHFDGKRFFNPGAAGGRGLFDVLRWKLTSRAEPSPNFVADVSQSKPALRVDVNEWRVTLINHSTVLLQQSGVNILTDPIWSDRASPFTWAGPRRRRQPGVAWQDLPPIDIVLASHNHYDHLDLPTLERLAQRAQPQFIVPKGVSRLLRSRGIGPLHELDWGESASLAQTTVHCVPALHFSGRSLSDRDRTLWCGYMIEASNRMVYFAGDTGFGWHFAAIRERFGPPRLALLPIGAYEPRWFMQSIHMSPPDAVRAHEILEARTSIAIHHGTFQLADDGIDTPKRELRAAGAGDSFLMLNNGQFATLA